VFNSSGNTEAMRDDEMARYTVTVPPIVSGIATGYHATPCVLVPSARTVKVGGISM
jgi:hypothetical protein